MITQRVRAFAAPAYVAFSRQKWPLCLLNASRTFASDSPWRWIKPKFTDRKRHYNEVLVFADVRKLLETAQKAIATESGGFPKAFWQIFAKRCIRSMHLFKPLELALIARAFDIHGVDYGIHSAVAAQVASVGANTAQLPGTGA